MHNLEGNIAQLTNEGRMPFKLSSACVIQLLECIKVFSELSAVQKPIPAKSEIQIFWRRETVVILYIIFKPQHRSYYLL